MMGTVFNIQKFCLSDGDGIRTTVFFKGCPLRCRWCHNPEGLSVAPVLLFYEAKCTACGKCCVECPARTLENGKLVFDRERCIHCGKCVDVCPNSANDLCGKEMTAEEVFDAVMRDEIFYKTSGGGITLSGGEPSMQSEFALTLLRMAKDAGISRAVETCGIGARSFYEKAAELGTVFLFDLKCRNAEKHRLLTGVSPEAIYRNLAYLFSVGADVILRLPLIPGENDDDEDLAALREFLLENSGKYRYAEIMPYHDFGIGKGRALGREPLVSYPSATKEQIDRWCRLLEPVTVKVSET